MNVPYDYIRPEVAEGFNLSEFKNHLQSLTSFADQLTYWNEYFDLATAIELEPSRWLSVNKNLKIYYLFYCENASCNTRSVVEASPERQAILTDWIRKHYEPLKAKFADLETYEDRVEFCRKYVDKRLTANGYAPGIGVFDREGIVFDTLPHTPEQWQFNNRVFYEYWEAFFLTYKDLKDRSLARRKEDFTKRIIHALHPGEELKKEQATILKLYEQPNEEYVVSSKTSQFFNSRKAGRNSTEEGELEFPSQSDAKFDYSSRVLEVIQAEHAYQYYKYLVNLQHSSDWLEELKSPLASATSMPVESDKTVILTHVQIAMLHHYNSQPITRNNRDEIARRYGQTSGQKLFDTYGKTTSSLVRTADAKTTIDNFKAVIPLLSGDALRLANNELAVAEKNNRKRLGK